FLGGGAEQGAGEGLLAVLERVDERASHEVIAAGAGLDGGGDIVVLHIIEDLFHDGGLAAVLFADDEQQPLEDDGQRREGGDQQRPHDGPALEEYMDHKVMLRSALKCFSKRSNVQQGYCRTAWRANARLRFIVGSLRWRFQVIRRCDRKNGARPWR